MARPMKAGLDWWKAEVDFLDDDKLEGALTLHGDVAVSVIFRLRSRIAKYGYCFRWNERDQVKFANRYGGKLEVFREVVRELLADGYFNAEVYDRTMILTSEDLQRRYIDACAERKQCGIKRSLFLLDPIEFPKVVIIEDELIGGITPINRRETGVSPRGVESNSGPLGSNSRPLESSRIEERRGEKRREDQRRAEEGESGETPGKPPPPPPVLKFDREGIRISSAEYETLLCELCDGDSGYLERNLEKAARRWWKKTGKPHHDSVGYIREWIYRERYEFQRHPTKPAPRRVVEPPKLEKPLIETPEQVAERKRLAGEFYAKHGRGRQSA